MRKRFSEEVEDARQSGSKRGDPFGAFSFTRYPARKPIKVMACDAVEELWHEFGYPLPMFEHVSVSLRDRTPTWDEMQWVKDLFWQEEELVLQYHPPASVYINNCQFCLHLWKIVGVTIPLPPPELVGIKEVGLLKPRHGTVPK